MLNVEKSITINAPVELDFAYGSDPNHPLEYYADVSAVQDVCPLPDGGYMCELTPHRAAIEAIEVIAEGAHRGDGACWRTV